MHKLTGTYDKGPVIDTNPVFDSVFVLERPKEFVFKAERIKADFSKNTPEDVFNVDWELSMPA